MVPLLQDFNILTNFMLKRAWCPAVKAEYSGLFETPGLGIETVAAADRAGYQVVAHPYDYYHAFHFDYD